MSTPVLQVSALGKRYRVFGSPHQRLLALLGLADRSSAHWALRDVSFELSRGQCLGVIGDNGAGKSTLLKLLAGTLHPSHGTVLLKGRVTAILELGAGFHPDFSGRDNLQFAGIFIGLSLADMNQLTDEIIAFSELGDAIDRPVKTYSSGMLVRLAFALVTAVQPDVLIIDEALAVGDQHFQKKCVERIDAFRQGGCTILFCSHSLYHVRQLCSHVLWLDGGQVRRFGETEGVLADYETHVRLQDAGATVAEIDPSAVVQTVDGMLQPSGRHVASLSRVVVSGLQAIPTGGEAMLLAGPDLEIQVQAVSSGDQPPSIGVLLEQFHGVGITSMATHAAGVKPLALDCSDGLTRWQIQLTFPDLPLHSGQYVLSFYLFDAKGLVVYEEWKNYIHFHWVSPSLTPGLVRLPHRWS